MNKIKVSVKEVGVGTPINPYRCKEGFLNTCWEMPEASICEDCRKSDQFEKEHPELPALDTNGNSLPVGEYEVELVWQYRPKGSQEKFIRCSDDLWEVQVNVFETRQVYIASVAPTLESLSIGKSNWQEKAQARQQPSIDEAVSDKYPHLTELSNQYKESQALSIEVDKFLSIEDGGYESVEQAFKCGSHFGARWEKQNTAALSVNKQPEKEVDAIEHDVCIICDENRSSKSFCADCGLNKAEERPIEFGLYGTDPYQLTNIDDAVQWFNENRGYCMDGEVDDIMEKATIFGAKWQEQHIKSTHVPIVTGQNYEEVKAAVTEFEKSIYEAHGKEYPEHVPVEEVEKIKSDNFTQGYMCAVANYITMFDRSVEAKDLLKQFGNVTYRDLKDKGVDISDLNTLKKHKLIKPQ